MIYKEYIGHDYEILKKYEIYEEIIREEDYTVCKAFDVLDVSQHWIVSVETFNVSPANINRLNQLALAFENGLFLCEKLLVSRSSSLLSLFLILPMPGRDGVTDFSLGCTRGDNFEIYFSLVSLISKYHSLEIPYLELNLRNIVFKGSVLYLQPFRICSEFFKESNYYSPPEILAGVSDLGLQFPADVWGLACVYAELFFSITPLFQGVTPYEKLLRMFEVLGVPKWRSVEKYMTWETYKGLKVLSCDIVADNIFDNIEYQNIILGMLNFDPDSRPKILELKRIWSPESNINDFSRDLSNYTFKNHEKLHKNNDYLSLGKKVDNTLVVVLHEIKWEWVDGIQNKYTFNVGYEISLNSNIDVVSDNFSIQSRTEIGFSQKFKINSDDFKRKYRHKPIIVNVYQTNSIDSRKYKETLIGSSEIYIGLLFSSSESIENNDNSVYGWYNLSNQSKILGQMLLEIKTKIPFIKSQIPNPI